MQAIFLKTRARQVFGIFVIIATAGGIAGPASATVLGNNTSITGTLLVGGLTTANGGLTVSGALTLPTGSININGSTLAGSLQTAKGGTGLTGYASGDVLVGSATGSLARLTAGSNGQVLTISGGVPTWQNSASGFSDPMTTIGDLIFRDGTNTTDRLGAGSDGQVLTISGGVPSWQNSAAGFTDPMTTRGDMIIRNASNATARLGRGTAGQLLKSDGTDISWQTLTKSDVGLGNVENTALSTFAGSANLTTLGTVTTGTWNATKIAVAHGGTGMTNYASGDLLVGSATSSLARLATGTNGQVLTVSGGVPSWQNASAGFTDPMTTRGDLIFRNATNTTARLGRGTANQVLRSDGTDLSWQSLTKSDVGLGNVENTALSTFAGSTNLTTLGTVTTGTWNATKIAVGAGGTGLTNYASGDVLVGSATGSLSRLPSGSSGQVLTISGGVPAWQTPAAGYVDPMTTRGDLVFRNASNTTARLPLGTSGQFLRSNGTDASWSTPTKSDVGLSNVENTALSTFAGSTNLTTLGTITTGTWNATKIAVGVGGTGLTNYASGDVLVGSATGSLARLASGSSGQVLTISGGVPSWQTPSAGFADPMTTRGDLIFRNASNTTARLPVGSNGTVLKSDGTDASWTTLTKSDVGLGNVENTALSTFTGSSNITTVGTLTSGSTGAGFTLNLGASAVSGRLAVNAGGTGMSGYANGDLLVGSATSSLSRLPSGSSGQVLTISGGVPSWQTPASGFADPMTTRGDLIFRNASNTTARLPVGTSGQLLKSDGTDASWTTFTKSDIGLGNVENTALTTWPGSSSITTLGTVTTGAWNATKIAVGAGGTGLTGYASGDVLIGSATGSLSRVAIGSSGQVLTVSGGVPTWQNASAGFADPMTSIGDMIFRNGLNATVRLPPGSANQVLTMSSGVPSWQNATSSSFVDPMTTAGDLIFRNASNVTSRLGHGGSGQVLLSDGGANIAWQTIDRTSVGLSNVENTALSTWPGSTNITTLGTIGTGIWNGTTIDEAHGGTGRTDTPAAGQLLIGLNDGSYALSTINDTPGSGITVVNGDGSITISQTPTVSAQATPADPSATSSTTGVMMGLAGSITPTKSGKVMIIISGDMDNDTASDGAQVQIRTGSGSAPANGAALTGTAQGALVKMVNPSGMLFVPGRQPFTVNVIVSGMTLNTAAWIDVSLGAITGGNARIRDVSVTATEL